MLDSCLLEDFLATDVEAASTFFLVEDDVFFTAASAVLTGVEDDFLTSLVGADFVVATFSVAVLGLVDDEVLGFVLLLTLVLDDETESGRVRQRRSSDKEAANLVQQSCASRQWWLSF